jgi:tetratricopeptide (TPR) repeat protein
MTNYVWSATDKSGKKVIKEIKAATAEDARFVLLSQGFLSLELKEDEVISAVLAGYPKRQNRFGAEIKVTAEARLEHRDDPTTTYWDVLRKGIGKNYLLFFGLIFSLGYSVFRMEWGYFLIYSIALAAWLAFLLFSGIQSVYYRKLIKVADWNRWEEVLYLLEVLQLIGHFRPVKLPPSELIRYRAKALIGLGDLQEGLAEFKQCEGRPDCPGWLYKLYLGGLHGIAQLHDKAIDYTLSSIAEKPTSTAWLDLANRYLRYKRDPIKARVAMAETEKSPLTDVARPFHLRCQGIIAYLEGNYSVAQQHLKAAIEIVESAKGRPFRDGFLAIARAYLCCVLARQGEMRAAEKYFVLARKYLVATKEDELLAECRKLCSQK